MVETLSGGNATVIEHVALERASARGHEEVVIEMLLRGNPDIDFKDKIYRKTSNNLHRGFGRDIVKQNL